MADGQRRGELRRAYSRPVTPRLTLGLTNFAAEDPGGWDHLLDRAGAADDAGIDRITVSDHVVYGEHLEAYGRPELGGAVGGRQPTGPDGHWLEPLTLLSVIAGVTSRVRLGTAVLLAALRRPVVLAKTAATLDVLSGGRLDLGVGVGWQREEYEAAGLSFHDRGRLLDHTLEVCQELWRHSPARIEAPELRFAGIHSRPAPVHADGVPIWVSGTVNRRVVDRVARFGMRWITWGEAMADPVAGVAAMRAALLQRGHDPSGLEVLGTLRVVKGDDGQPDFAATMAQVPAMVGAGVTDFRVQLSLPAGRAEATDVLGAAAAAFRAAG
jgi:probable F420-dependent oxidoreductase